MTGTMMVLDHCSDLAVYVAHWRDYLNPVAVFDALGWPGADA